MTETIKSSWCLLPERNLGQRIGSVGEAANEMMSSVKYVIIIA